MAPGHVHLVATFYPKADKFDEVAAAVTELTKKVEATEPDVLTYYAFRTEKEIVFVETYKTIEAHEAHTKTEHFQSVVGKISPLLEKPLQIKQGSFISGFEHRV
ncbi:hypothetical protein HRR83_000947 [Exophiala dermatitidis]|uniref:ABM domain-containing protein n=1 Tax=Exophiala dermatitidis TaxID=5970 RepID=A0AAN6IZB1_EXODE|nr:hypothetical protein HRR75_000860 [Exophiala dermatitidis]KAJ4528196.1 hypothetical protein HRR74_000951 [Exophiala dermatitidis]KAJ4528829.1 hypothetical protein HRR73_001452 [Exophiala dermatitidis]KAJ4530218.1 hypothetical protein HRR76_009448 [Exophiala dermatitidis]KAJ4553156.1 hypothetical protein HRR78_003415 [Exophiala dermatitidis]